MQKGVKFYNKINQMQRIKYHFEQYFGTKRIDKIVKFICKKVDKKGQNGQLI